MLEAREANNSADKLRHPRSDAYSGELVLPNKRQEKTTQSERHLLHIRLISIPCLFTYLLPQVGMCWKMFGLAYAKEPCKTAVTH